MYARYETKKSALSKFRDFVEDKLNYLLLVAPIVLIASFVIGLVAIHTHLGIFPFGPQKEVTATVQRLYVDVSGYKDSTQSHYMVGTDKGVFEVSNSLWLWIWDADRRYSQLETGKTFNLQVKGNEIVNFFFQEYPHVLTVNLTK